MAYDHGDVLRAINHIFLPPQLPQSEDTKSEEKLPLIVLDTLKNQPQDLRLDNMIYLLQSISFSDKQLSSAISKLKPGQMIAINVPAQNAAILVSKQKRWLFETFELSPQDQAVMKMGRMTRTFPDRAVKVENLDFLPSFLKALAKMRVQPVEAMQPKTKKSGKAHAEIRDTTNPGVLNILFSVLQGEETGNGITKQTRDDVLWKDTLRPWRRSPIWLLIRVALQLLFKRSANTIHYKKVLTYIMTNMLENDLPMDLRYIMQAKIDRRLAKMQTTGESIEIIQSLLQESQARMEPGIVQDRADLHLKHLQFYSDTLIDLPDINTPLQNNTSHQEFTPTSGLMDPPQLGKSTSIPEIIANLQSFEQWVADPYQSTPEILAPLAEQYHQMASSVYNTPEAISVMILTSFSLWKAIDSAAIKICPILEQYAPKIPTQYFTTLLLKTKAQMEQLAEIESYLSQRTGSDPFTMNGFAVRFVNQSPLYQRIHQRIKEEAEKAQERKLKELSSKKDEYIRLHDLWSNNDCDEIVKEVTNQYGKTGTVKSHSSSCQRCAWKWQIDHLTINIHEQPLPNDETAKTVVFELSVPTWYGNWRDGFSHLLNVLDCTYQDSSSPYCLLDDDPHLMKRYEDTSRITLASQTKPHVKSHYKTKLVTNTTTAADICMNTGLHYRYYDRRVRRYIGNITCSHKIEQACTYTVSKPLQQYIWRPASNPNGPTPNTIIAEQDLCPADMTLEEFKELAAVPYGLKLQWYNIKSQLAYPTVDFKKLDSTLVFLQCCYQTGPAGDVLRSHSVLNTVTIIDEIKLAFSRLKSNWQSFNAIAMFSSLITRIHSIRPEGCHEALQDIKKVTSDWARSLEKKDLMRESGQLALICLSTYDLENSEASLDVSTLIQMIVLVNQSRELLQDTLSAILQWRVTRMLHRNLNQIAADMQGLNDGIKQIWSGFQPGSWKRTGQWMHSRRKQSVYINLLDGELLVNGLPLEQAPAE